MKTIKIYNGSFTCFQDMINNFRLNPSELKGCMIIYAEYDQNQYDGNAFVVFTRDNKLFEVNSNHCSCNGLEWQEEETLIESILIRSISEDCRYNLENISMIEKLMVFDN